MTFLVWLNEHFNIFRNVHILKGMNKPEWRLSQIVLKEAKDGDLDFLLNEAKDRLKTTTDIADNLTNRSMLLFSVAITAIITMVGYAGQHLEFTAGILSLFCASALLLVGCSILKPNIVPQEYFANGVDPSDLAVDGMFVDLDGKKPEWYMKAKMIEAYEYRIKVNRGVNEDKANRIQDFINYLFAIPPMFAMVYLLFALFAKLFC